MIIEQTAISVSQDRKQKMEEKETVRQVEFDKNN
jgi:hypothetical protein